MKKSLYISVLRTIYSCFFFYAIYILHRKYFECMRTEYHRNVLKNPQIFSSFIFSRTVHIYVVFRVQVMMLFYHTNTRLIPSTLIANSIPHHTPSRSIYILASSENCSYIFQMYFFSLRYILIFKCLFFIIVFISGKK